jgi:hypothetical protein
MGIPFNDYPYRNNFGADWQGNIGIIFMFFFKQKRFYLYDPLKTGYLKESIFLIFFSLKVNYIYI